ncbi:MAG TPA: DinB family protein [Pseudonocardiaceae bacterium]|jgi:uncharacterized damage-inducible protein DinB|nr:DinB family protein [Pseudonocardiaceae bacterium]
MPANAPQVTDERDGLLGFLAQQRLVLRVAAHGLTDEQARLAPTASSLTIGGLVKHVATAERVWIGRIVNRRPLPRDEAIRAYEDNFRLGPNETLEEVLDLYAKVAKETEAAVAGVADLGQAVPVPPDASWAGEVTSWSVRWILLHLIEETARHAGHADIVRESLDGATALPLLAAVENWPPSPWIEPWAPTAN